MGDGCRRSGQGSSSQAQSVARLLSSSLHKQMFNQMLGAASKGKSDEYCISRNLIWQSVPG